MRQLGVLSSLTAVVIEAVDAVVAHGAVRATRRPVEVTRDAPLHTHRDTADLHVPVQW